MTLIENLKEYGTIVPCDVRYQLEDAPRSGRLFQQSAWPNSCACSVLGRHIVESREKVFLVPAAKQATYAEMSTAESLRQTQ